MKFYIICLTLLGFLFWETAFSQTLDLQRIDNTLTNTFKIMIAADYNLRYDSLAPAFKQKLEEQLVNPITFNNSLDSLSKYVSVKVSPDKNIKFYSWDEIEGGTWHSINCFAQFKSDKGTIVVQQLNADSSSDSVDFTDSGIYEVYEILINNTKYYLTFAAGTHGGGHQHEIVQIFSITSDKLVKCTSFFTTNTDLIIEYPRSEKLNLIFNQKTNEISYSEFKFDNEVGFYKSTGQVIRLKLKNGRFTTM